MNASGTLRVRTGGIIYTIPKLFVLSFRNRSWELAQTPWQISCLKDIYNPAQMKLSPVTPFHVFTSTSPVTEYNRTGGDGIRFSTLGF